MRSNEGSDELELNRATRSRRQAFGRRLRELRAEAGLSQEAFADRAGLHRTYVGSVERGERNLSLDAMHALPDALQVSPAVFFTTKLPRQPAI